MFACVRAHALLSFAVQEACFYECDVNLGNFLKNKTKNPWELFNVPVRAAYCDAWWSVRNHGRLCPAPAPFPLARDLTTSLVYFFCASEKKPNTKACLLQ